MAPASLPSAVILFLRSRGSRFAESLARIAGSGLETLDLDAVQDGAALSVEEERVLWQGRDLGAARAVIVEELEFAWPQPLTRGGRACASGAATLARDREERSLALSALCAAAERVPMIDPPALAHLAVAPLYALAVLAEQGLPVQPWRLEPARPDAGDDGRLWLDPVGRERWYAPQPPLPGEPAWTPELPSAGGGAVLSVLVAGARAVGGLRFADGAAWARGSDATAVSSTELEAGSAATALSAARALAAHAATVDLVLATGAVLYARPGPDWSRWEAALGPSVPRALWEHAQGLEPL